MSRASDPFASLGDEARERLRRRAQPRWTGPMLATLSHEPFSDDGWVFERKLDGVRCLAFRKGRRVTLRSRNRKEQNATYPELVEALAAQRQRDFVLDGEVVALAGSATSFERLQGRLGLADRERALASGIPVLFYVFDVLYLAGHDTTRLALRDRKHLLREAIDFGDPLRFTMHRNADGEHLLREACAKGWEGLIAKRASSPYVHKRSTDWLKLKCESRQELVIGGYTEPEGTRVGFGALLLGYHEGADLVYAGKVGTGWTDDALRSLAKVLAGLERRRSPFAGTGVPTKGVHWVAPKLVAEVAFTEWTRAGRLRHPRFLGLRRDKDARRVVRERPKARS